MILVRKRWPSEGDIATSYTTSKGIVMIRLRSQCSFALTAFVAPIVEVAEDPFTFRRLAAGRSSHFSEEI
jgi:hypothetical protein